MIKQPTNSDCAELNRTWGAPERIVFRPSKQNVPIVVLANQYGTAEVSLLGAQTISYRPTGQPPVLYLPHPYDSKSQGAEIHGGIPVCWPWFARNGPQGTRAHGLARYAVWHVKSSEYSEELTQITLACSDTEETRKIWPHAFDLELTISISMKLTLALHTQNTGTTPFDVTEGFHPYFAVSACPQAEVLGINGFTFVDDACPEKTEPRVWAGSYPVRTTGGSLIFDATRFEYVLMDHGLNRAIAVVSRGNRRLVVWNPGEQSADRVDAFGREGWRKFVCVEPCSTPKDVAYTLKPGESHDLLMAIQSVSKNP